MITTYRLFADVTEIGIISVSLMCYPIFQGRPMNPI